MNKLLFKKFTLLTVILLMLLAPTVLANTDERSLANTHEHYLSKKTVIGYKDLGSGQHYVGYIISEYCRYCNYEVIIDTYSTTKPHNLSTGDYHAGTLHFIINRCNDCTFDESYSYKCPGNPCIIPASIDYTNEEIDSLTILEDELDFITSFSIEDHDTCSNHEHNNCFIESTKLEDELDFINTLFMEKNNTYLDEESNSLNAAGCTDHRPMKVHFTNFDDNGPHGHTYTYIEAYMCDNCGSKTITTTIGPISEPHKITTSHYHSGTLHFVTESCYECPYDYTYSYKCPGNPCIIPTD